MENPKVSVLVPVYGVERYVGRCLRSLFANSIIDRCEVIIVDDCSPDGSMREVAAVLDEYPHLRGNVVLRSHDCNRGSAAARNTALLQAHGTYVICVDSDDWVEPTYLEELYDEAERSGADIVGCNYVIEYKDRSEQSPKPFRQSKDWLRDLLADRISQGLWCKLFRKSLLDAHGIRWVEGLDMGEDRLFSVKAFFHARSFSCVDSCLYHYDRRNADSMCYHQDEKAVAQFVSILQHIEDFLRANGCLAAYRDDFSVQKIRVKAHALSAVADSGQYVSLWERDMLHKARTTEPIPARQRLLMFLCDARLSGLVRLWLLAQKAWRLVRYGKR